MNIVLVGASGYVGSRMLRVAIAQGHSVVATTRHPEKLPADALVTPLAVDVADAVALAEAFRDRDAVIHAYAPTEARDALERIDKQRPGTAAIIEISAMPDQKVFSYVREEVCRSEDGPGISGNKQLVQVRGYLP